jgi:hypothetical protein
MRQLVQQGGRLPVVFKRLEEVGNVGSVTIRELGNTFQLRRMPSRSSTSDHCSMVSLAHLLEI